LGPCELPKLPQLILSVLPSVLSADSGSHRWYMLMTQCAEFEENAPHTTVNGQSVVDFSRLSREDVREYLDLVTSLRSETHSARLNRILLVEEGE
jgi:hypothetical protein